MLRSILLSSVALTLLAFGCANDTESGTEVEDMMEGGATAGTATAGTATAGTATAGTATAGTATAGITGDIGGEVVMPVAGTVTAGDTPPPGGMMTGGEMTPGGGMVPTPGGNCDPAFLECMNGCQDQNCQQSCFTNAPSETQTLFNAFQSCIQNSGCQTTGCILMTCENEYTACYGEIPMGSGDCNSILDCLPTCSETDQACFEGCIYGATIEAQLQFFEAQECVINSIDSGMCADDDTACYNMACQTELLACVGQGGNPGGPGGAPAPGSLSCGGTLVCLQECQPTDMACQQDCGAGLSMDDVDAFEGLGDCAEMNCATSMEEGCLEMNCQAELDACFPVGTLSCGEVLSCFEGCTDQYCLVECQLDADEAAQMELGALSMCIGSNDTCMGLDCPECATEYEACAN